MIYRHLLNKSGIENQKPIELPIADKEAAPFSELG